MRSTPQFNKLIIALIASLLTCTVAYSAPADNEILAVVNETPIMLQDLAEETSLLNAEMRHRNTAISKRKLARMKRQLLENLIERELLYQRAQQKKIKIRNRWVDRAVLDLKSELKAKSGYKDYLAKAKISKDQLRARIKKGLIVRRLLRREVLRQIKVGESEMQAFYRDHPEFFQSREQVRVRQIMVAVNKTGKRTGRGDALLRIQNIQNLLKQGGNFSALALDYSEDNSRTKGGDLGYLQRGQMIAPFADAAFTLEPGQVSNIVETPLGYHLIKMVDKIPSSQTAYRNARTKIERTLRRNKEKKATDTYLAKLKRRASITRLARF